jgi:hypothetical protein
MHNGGIAHFRQVQRPLLATLSQRAFEAIHGTTITIIITITMTSPSHLLSTSPLQSLPLSPCSPSLLACIHSTRANTHFMSNCFVFHSYAHYLEPCSLLIPLSLVVLIQGAPLQAPRIPSSSGRISPTSHTPSLSRRAWLWRRLG